MGNDKKPATPPKPAGGTVPPGQKPGPGNKNNQTDGSTTQRPPQSRR